MARLPRVTQKIFANSAPSNQVTTFGSIKAGAPSYTKNISQIMNSNYDSGWSDAVEDDYAPYRQDRNAVDLSITQQLAYLLCEGIPEYDSGTTYYFGHIVKVVESNLIKLYMAIANGITSASAITDTTKWRLFITIDNTGALTGVTIKSSTFNNPSLTGTATAPNPSASDNSTKIATTHWVNTVGNNVMHLTGNETAAGDKTFTGASTFNGIVIKKLTTLEYTGFNVQNTAITKGTTPSSNVGGQFVFQDSAGVGVANRIGGIETVYESDGDIVTHLQAFEPVANSSNKASIDIVYKANGQTFATAPTPPAGDNSTKIATTEWITNSTEEVIAITERYSLGNTFYTIYSDGWIEQGGLSASVPANSSVTITFPKAFSDSLYNVDLTFYGSAITGGEGYLVVQPIDATSFTLYNGSDNAHQVYWKACGRSNQ